MVDLVCVSHLRWDFGWQRQRQMVSQFSGRVLFIEDPLIVSNVDEPQLDLHFERERLTVMRMLYPADYCRDGIIPHSLSLLFPYLRTTGFDDPIVWLYTPMGMELAEMLPYRLLVYDVTDTLDPMVEGFHERESLLLRQANVVLAGTRPLYESHFRHNPHTYFAPDGLDMMKIEGIIQQRINDIYTDECFCW